MAKHDYEHINYENEYIYTNEEKRQMRRQSKIHTYALLGIFAFLGLISFSLLYVVYELYFKSSSITAVEPMTTALTTTYNGTKDLGTHLHKRFYWQLAVAVFKTVNLGFSILGLEQSCQGFNGGTFATKSLCIFGAISTAITIGSIGGNALLDQASKAGTIAGQGAQAGFAAIGSRDNSNYTDVLSILDEFAGNMSTRLNMPYKYHGMLSKNNTLHGHMVPDGHHSWPVYELTTHEGEIMHHTMIKVANGIGVHRLGYAPYNTKRDVYNQEYFTAGAIDYTGCDDGSNSDQFNTGDSGYVNSQLQCAISNIDDVSDLEYQILDDTNSETVSSGSIAGVGTDGRSRINDDPTCPSGLTPSGCGESNSSG